MLAVSQEPSFGELFERLRQGDNTAAARVLDRYAGRLIAVARTHLDARLRRRVDAEDVLQSVLRSFFVRVADGKISVPDWDSLWGLLVCITVRKCIRARTRHRAGVRDVTREVAPSAEGDDSGPVWEVISREPGPAEGALLSEALDQATRGLPEQGTRAVLLTLQGHAIPEVAEQLGCSIRKVYRVLDHVRDRLERLRAEDRD
jgi:RNA polymerase sigma factor (sigma-70 family)